MLALAVVGLYPPILVPPTIHGLGTLGGFAVARVTFTGSGAISVRRRQAGCARGADTQSVLQQFPESVETFDFPIDS